MNLYENPDQESEETQMTLDELNEFREGCHQVMDKAKAAAKLAQYPEFQSIIMDQYFLQEPQRLGALMATGQLTPKSFDDAAYDLRSIGHLRRFISGLIESGNIAAGELAEAEAARDEFFASQEGGK